MKSLPSSFLPRLFSTLILWGVVITVVWLKSELGYCLLILTAALGSLWEYFWLLKISHLPRNWRIGYISGISILLGNCWLLHNNFMSKENIFSFDAALIILTVVFLFFREFFRPQDAKATLKVAAANKEEGVDDVQRIASYQKVDGMRTDATPSIGAEIGSEGRFSQRTSAEGIAFTLFGVIYIPWLFSFVLKILYLTPRTATGELSGTYYALLLVIITKFSDVGAFLCGSLFGKHLFCPNISPKKTWEGFFGALALSLSCSLGFYFLFPQELPLLTPTIVVALSLILAPIGIAGDLAESLLKRSLHTKDSSHTLPGIGGGMDLIDSILFTAPIFYFILRFLLARS